MTINRSSIHSLLTLVVVSSFLFGLTGCTVLDHRFPNPMTLTAAQGPPVAAGLRSPIGLADDPKGNLWVTEAGSGTANDGQVSVITPSGARFPVITGFISALSPENSPEGLNHLAYKDGKLYILHAITDFLYVADVSSFVPGVSAPIAAGSLTSFDIGTFVKNAYPNAPDPKDSNPYNLTFGPNGDLFITDAGGNAIVRRDKNNGNLSIYAIFPDAPNPTMPRVGPPTIDPVPTGIVFDGTNFLVSTLHGFPFPPGIAKIYQVSGTGTAPITPTVYKDGFSGLTDIVLTPGGKPFVTEFGFTPPGRIATGDNPATTLFAPAITPVDILLSTVNPDTYYVLYYGPGIIVKFTATN
ncbi:ScyD/ScyE family protein [Spirosoma areae]